MPSNDTNQTTIAEVVRVAVTRDKRFRICFPLPPAKAAIKQPAGTHWQVILREMNRWLNLGHAVACPLTGHLVRVYRRGLHVSQVATLKRLRQAMNDTGAAFVHLRQFSGRRDGDLAKLAFWGLVESKASDSGARDRGFWRVTDKGRLWLFGDVRIPRQIALLNGEFLGYVDERDTIGPKDVDDEFDVARLKAGTDGVPVPAGAGA